MYKLSQRLLEIQKSISRDSHFVWDICCDHGRLGLSLQYISDQFSKLERVILLDKVSDITSRLENKQDNLIRVITADARSFNFSSPAKTKNTFVLAGIGAHLGKEIAGNIFASMNKSDQFIFCIHQNELIFRKFLKETTLLLRKKFCYNIFFCYFTRA